MQSPRYGKLDGRQIQFQCTGSLEHVALIAASELRSLLEIAHLTVSAENARRLERALRDARAARRMTRMSTQQLRAWAESAPKGGKRAGRKG